MADDRDITELRDAIDALRHDIQTKWRPLLNTKDDQQDKMADAIDAVRERRDNLRKRRDDLEKHHPNWSKDELHDRRLELADAIHDASNLIDRLLERLERVHDKAHKAREKVQEKHDRIDRLEKKVAYLQAHPPSTPTGGLIVTFDGKPCAHWIADILAAARRAGSWSGIMLSGVRTVAESIGLCEAMCNAPSCPGTCAGAATNHTCPPTHTCEPHEGAADVTDPSDLEHYCTAHALPLHGNGEMLPADLNHFSNSGR